MSPRDSTAAARRPVIPEDDPLWAAAMRAPVDYGPVPEQELLDVEAALAAGEFVDGAVVTAEIAARRP
jgi:hypothetical protein